MDDCTSVPLPLKRCTKCGEEQPRERFSKDKSTKDGLKHRCKSCCRAYEIENAERLREWHKENYALNREQIRAKSRADYAANKEPILARQRKRYAENKAAIRQRRAQNSFNMLEYSRAYYRKNHGRLREQARAYNAANPHIVRNGQHRRRARIANIGGSYTEKDVAHMRAIQQGHCCYCGRLGQRLTLEHIIPVTREGSSNDPWNLALACRRCNCSKQDRLLEEWTNRWYLVEDLHS